MAIFADKQRDWEARSMARHDRKMDQDEQLDAALERLEEQTYEEIMGWTVEQLLEHVQYVRAPLHKVTRIDLRKDTDLTYKQVCRPYDFDLINLLTLVAREIAEASAEKLINSEPDWTDSDMDADQFDKSDMD